MRSVQAALAALLLSLSAQAATLHGRVTDPTGKPVVGVEVVTGSLSTRTNAAGAFSFEVADGKHLIEINASSFAAESVSVDVMTGAMIEVTLRPILAATLTVMAETSPETQRVAGGTAMVPEAQIRETRAHTLQDVLTFVPGVVANSRFGADETQLSVRGSGLRNNFHLRGINILVNGIPYQDADGFSDFESLDLFATERVQVWKGANALQYGGSSMGGAINLVTYDGATAAPLSARLEGGSFGLTKAQIGSGGNRETLAWFGSLSHTQQDGYREWSEQRRTRFLGNLDLRLRENTTLRFDGIYADVSEHLPGALTADQFRTSPRDADPNNVTGKWGRFFDYTRVAAQLLHSFDPDRDLGLFVFTQTRDMVHPIFQILDQDATNSGAEANIRMRGSRYRLVAGVTSLWGGADERRFENRSGDRGPLAADFTNGATSWAAYAEHQFDATPLMTLTIGARADSARRTFDDHFLGDGDRSDSRTFSSFSPRFGLLWSVASNAQLFANASRSYEPPLLLELTSFGAPGFIDLDAQSTWQFEIGSRGQRGGFGWDAALYDAEIDDEIVNVNVRPFPNAPFTVPSYRNVARTRHRGVEIGGQARMGDLSARIAYTLSDFRFVDNPEFAGNRLPGAAPHIIHAELRADLRGERWLATSIDWSPQRFFADSANSVTSDPYAVVNLRGGWTWRSLETFAEISNITDEHYSPTVQVDSAVGRFFEPGTPRSISIGVRWAAPRR